MQDKKLDERLLITMSLDGDLQAYGQIVECYRRTMIAVAYSRCGNFHDAEDIAQNVFLEAFDRLSGLKNPDRLGAWLRTITIHRTIDMIRKSRPCVEFDEQHDHANEKEIKFAESRSTVYKAIEKLPKAQKETLVMHYLSGMQIKHIAAIQEVPVGTVKRRLHDARLTLKKEVTNMVAESLKKEPLSDDFSARVFEILNCFPSQKFRVYHPKIREELRQITEEGIEGLIQAIGQAHWQTRRNALDLILFNEPTQTELVVKLLKDALSDTNRNIRGGAVNRLLGMKQVDDQRKISEFIPLIEKLLCDPSGKVRWRTAFELSNPSWAPHVSLKAIAEALQFHNGHGAHQALHVILKLKAG